MWILYELDVKTKDGEEFTAYSVEPDFGPEHSPSPDCWCKPEYSNDVENLIIHNVLN